MLLYSTVSVLQDDLKCFTLRHPMRHFRNVHIGQSMSSVHCSDRASQVSTEPYFWPCDNRDLAGDDGIHLIVCVHGLDGMCCLVDVSRTHLHALALTHSLRTHTHKRTRTHTHTHTHLLYVHHHICLSFLCSLTHLFVFFVFM